MDAGNGGDGTAEPDVRACGGLPAVKPLTMEDMETAGAFSAASESCIAKPRRLGRGGAKVGPPRVPASGLCRGPCCAAQLLPERSPRLPLADRSIIAKPSAPWFPASCGRPGPASKR